MATHRQTVVANKVLLDKVGVGEAMRSAGYKPSMVKNPQKVTQSKGWQELMNKHLPDSHLGAKHREFLDAQRLIRTYKKGDLVAETIETDPSAVKALDMAYKLKGRYNADEVNKTLIINISGESAARYGVTPQVVHEQVQDITAQTVETKDGAVGGVPDPQTS